MGMDIHITVLARKEQDSEHPESTYRALEFNKEGKPTPFTFPYFRNRFFFEFLQDVAVGGRWDVVNGNIEHEDAIDWYLEEDSGLWGHSYIRLKEISEMILNLEFDIYKFRDTKDADLLAQYNCDDVESAEEILDMLKYVYKSAKLMMDFDVLLEDRWNLEYDIDNSILLIAYDN
jgi:hypothetical protein